MIKELTENPEKEFISLKGGNRLKLTATNINGSLYIKAFDGNAAPDGINIGSREWEEVKEPVDFMTAFEAYYKYGRDMYCMFDGEKYVFSQKYGPANFREILIAQGKWYIGK